MTPIVLFSFVIAYFLVLLVVAWYTSRNSNNETFFSGNKNSNWMLVAFGMIGTSLSGVTFVSVPGTVGNISATGFNGFAYFQVIIGYIFGYLAIAYVLIPLYYKLNLTSIYGYLRQRFGPNSQKIGAVFFLVTPPSCIPWALLGHGAARLLFFSRDIHLIVQVHEQRIARKGRWAVVGRVAGSSGGERQYLPKPLPCGSD